MLDNKPYTFDRVFRIAVTVGGIFAIIWLFDYLSEALIPFAVAFLLAYLINPIVCAVQKKVSHRMAAVLLTLLGLGIVLVISTSLLMKPIKSNFAHMKEIVTQKMAKSERVAKLFDKANELGVDIFKKGEQKDLVKLAKTEKYQNLAKAAIAKVFPVAKSAMGGIFKTAWSLTLFLLGLTIIFLYLIFILADYQEVRNDWKKFLPESWKNHIAEFVVEFDSIMNKHFRAQAIVAILVGILFAVGFSIIGLPMAILLGLFIGALNMIPYMQVLGLLPAGLMALMMAIDNDSSITSALLWTGAVFAVVQIIQDAVLVPRIMGKVTGLKPAMILLSISIWGKLLGFLGLLIALPMTCLVIAYYRRFILKHS